MATKKRRSVSIPSDILQKLLEEGELEVDSIGRVKGFPIFFRRLIRQRGRQ